MSDPSSFASEKAARGQAYDAAGVSPGTGHQRSSRARIGSARSIVLAVRATGPKGKHPPGRIPRSLTVIPPLAHAIHAEAAERRERRGTDLDRHRVRAIASSAPKPTGSRNQLADSDRPAYLDETTTYGTRYRYLVQTIAGRNQWSVVSEAAEITPVDIFPPAVPEGLSAVPDTAIDRARLDA